jgi:glutamate--cysteine ligase
MVIKELQSNFSHEKHAARAVEIADRLAAQCVQVEAWFQEQWQQVTPPMTGSVDLRHAGFKLAPVDMNMYPAGFNNLNNVAKKDAVKVVSKALKARAPKAKRILIVPENHTRNKLYWESVAVQQTMLIAAGYDVRVAAFDENVSAQIKLNDGDVLTVGQLIREQDRLVCHDFNPDILWLNNDMSAGIPPLFDNLVQPIFPPPGLGWHQRLKSVHFNYYDQVVADFAQTLQWDAWLFNPLFQHCGDVDFLRKEGYDCIALNVDRLLSMIREKYARYSISADPFVVLKADSGTYGMGITIVKSVDDVYALNRKRRTKMSASKGQGSVRRVILQEGVPSYETLAVDGATAEPVVYMLGDTVIGGFYRLHASKGAEDNLNAPGMYFEPMDAPFSCAVEQLCQHDDFNSRKAYHYSVVARLSMLAASYERRYYEA